MVTIFRGRTQPISSLLVSLGCVWLSSGCGGGDSPDSLDDVFTPMQPTVGYTSMKALSDGKILVGGYQDKKIIPGNTCGGVDGKYIFHRFTATGQEDLTFGTNGSTEFPFEVGLDRLYDMIVLPDGKILSVGEVGYESSISGTCGMSGKYRIGVTKMNANGTADSSFGTNGQFNRELLYTLSGASTVRVQANGKMLITGHHYSANFLARLNMDGSLDTSFATQGYLDHNPAKNVLGLIYGPRLELQSSEKPVTLVLKDFDGSNHNYVLSRYTTSGVVDTSFGSGGSVTVWSNFKILIAGYHLKILSSDRILAVISLYNAATDRYEIGFFRYDANGGVDVSFGSNGLSRHGITRIVNGAQEPWDIPITEVAIGSDEKIYLAMDHRVMKFNANGTVDTSFGASGTFQIIDDPNSTYVHGIHRDQRVRAGGITVLPDHSLLVRYGTGIAKIKADGSGYDTTFGTNGVLNKTYVLE